MVKAIETPDDLNLESLIRIVQQMGGLCEAQLLDGVTAIVKRDSELAQRVIAGDREVDALERQVEQTAVRYLAARQPQGKDLRLALSAIKIAADLERIGDLAKNISKRSLVVNREQPLRQSLSRGLARMGEQAVTQVKNVLDAFAARDADQAMAVWRRDEEVDELYNSLFREFLTYMMEDPRTIGFCTHLLFAAKNLERVGDHATNIAENIVYLVSGSYVSDSRPKGDMTSLTAVSFEEPDTDVQGN